MRADSVPTNRNRSAFYAYRKRPSPSPSVCSSASSSAASTSARSVSRSQLVSTGSYEARNSRPTSALSAGNGAAASAEHAAALSIQEASSAVASTSAAAASSSHRRRSTRRTDPKFNSIANLTKTPRDFEIAVEREYADDIVKYMSAMEEPTGASVELIDQQPELAWYMRPYLIDFLVEVHSQCRLRQETLHLAVNICDRYTSKRIVYKRHYQLVGCAALWIAAKFEDAKDRVPTVQELCTITCNAYDASAFIQMEGHVLATLDWLIGHPTSEAWLRVASVSDPTMLAADSTLQHVTRFLMELTLFHRAFVPLKSSEIALGCLLLARYICGKARKLSDETPIAIQIAQMLDSHLSEHLEQVSVILTKKYASPDYANASQIVQQWYLAGRRFDIASWPSFYASTLAPISHPLRRDSASSTSIFTSSSAASSPRSYLGSSSDDEDAPVTPSTPLTPFGGSESDNGIQRAFSSPLATRAPINAKSAVYKATGSTPENTAAALKVKLVPTSGPSMTLC